MRLAGTFSGPGSARRPLSPLFSAGSTGGTAASAPRHWVSRPVAGEDALNLLRIDPVVAKQAIGERVLHFDQPEQKHGGLDQGHSAAIRFAACALKRLL